MIWLLGEVLLVSAGLVLLARFIAPYLRGLRDIDDTRLSPRRREHLGVCVDIWLPIALALPLLAVAYSASAEVDQGFGWVPIAGPIGAALLTAGVGLLVGRGAATFELRRMVPWAIAGGLLWLLAVSHHLTIVSGQLFFAGGAVLLWILTPPSGRGDTTPAPRDEVRAGWALLVILGVALGIAGVVLKLIGSDPATTSARTAVMIALGWSGIGGVILARGAGTARALRLAGGVAIAGAIFGTGGLGLSQLLRQASGVLADEGVLIGPRIVRGFGVFELESGLLVLFAACAAAAGTASPWFRRAMGGLLAAAGMLVLVRFAAG